MRTVNGQWSMGRVLSQTTCISTCIDPTNVKGDVHHQEKNIKHLQVQLINVVVVGTWLEYSSTFRFRNR